MLRTTPPDLTAETLVDNEEEEPDFQGAKSDKGIEDDEDGEEEDEKEHGTAEVFLNSLSKELGS